MKVVIFGASGMVGGGVFLECLEDPQVESVLVVGRRSCGVTHLKLQELLRPDLFDLTELRDDLAGLDACFFCLGISAAGMSEADYTTVTRDLTIAVATLLQELNSGLTFCYVSGQGTDSTERGGFMWARVKGQTENRLLAMPFDAYMFRPGYIQAMKGVRSSTKLYQAVYTVVAPFYPIMRRVFPAQMTTTVNVGRAMIEAARAGYSKKILEVRDINALAGVAE